MLVLSRRVDETITIPEAGIAVQVLSIAGNRVKIGVEAPQDLGVLRGELAADALERVHRAKTQRVLSRQEFHDLKNQLHAIRLTVHLAHRQREIGSQDAADEALDRLFDQFESVQGLVFDREITRDRVALLVEDDANERELLAGLLRMSGYQVETACDGLDALDYLRAHASPDVVLLDMRMPRCDGPKTVRNIRNNAKTSGLRVFAVSATSPAELGIATGPGGVDGWFEKPLNPEHLARQIRRLSKPVASA